MAMMTKKLVAVRDVNVDINTLPVISLSSFSSVRIFCRIPQVFASLFAASSRKARKRTLMPGREADDVPGVSAGKGASVGVRQPNLLTVFSAGSILHLQ
ncbi:MAG: hypothetical protein QMD99_16275 [Rhizobiaceae bacterium]|nr:hypothetical protein [Rhizobiaceae bacterium]